MEMWQLVECWMYDQPTSPSLSMTLAEQKGIGGMFITKQNHIYHKRNKDDCPFDFNSRAQPKWIVLSSLRCLCKAHKEELLFNSKML